MSKSKNDKGENNNIPDEQGLLIVTSIIKNKEIEPNKNIPSKTKEKTIEEETNNNISPIFKEKNEFKKEIPEDIFTGKNENEEEKPEEEEELSFSEEKKEPDKKTPLIPLDETNQNKNIDQDLKKKESLFSGNIKPDPKHMFTTVNYYKSKIKMNKSNNNIKTNENEAIAFISNDNKINPQNKNINNITKFIYYN